MNYYERHIGDYLKDTAHLSLLEHGIYGRLLDIYYSREAGLPSDQIARLVGARSKEEKDALRCVLAEFFVLDAGGLYVQARCQGEIARFHEKQAQAQRAARASVASRQASAERALNGRSTAAEPTLSVPSNQTPVTNKKTSSPSATGFEVFWKAYPRKVGKDAARKAFEKRKPDASLLARMLEALGVQVRGEAWRKDGGQFIPHPATWLNEGRWQDEGVVLPDQAPRPVYQAPPPMTPEERARSDEARKRVMAAFHTEKAA